MSALFQRYYSIAAYQKQNPDGMIFNTVCVEVMYYSDQLGHEVTGLIIKNLCSGSVLGIVPVIKVS